MVLQQKETGYDILSSMMSQDLIQIQLNISDLINNTV